MAECPECGGNVETGENPEVAELIECSECGAQLEIREIDPIKLEKAPEEEEDWGE